MTARYDAQLEQWAFECDSIEFNLSGIPFNEMAFDWAKEASATIRVLNSEIQSRVMESLEDWPCDKTTAEILCVDLDEYGQSKTMDVAFVGDESWGDFGVNVIITNGRIVEAYGGD
ncbi:MAG: hypothetical protein JWM68_664 [Verrucomicrobiales bacterium]|nr:hypothetical protein [Verrucomicrobiales bacterium]